MNKSIRYSTISDSKNLMKDLQSAARRQSTQTEFTDRKKKDEFYWSSAWRNKVQRIKDRDNHECQCCRREGRVTINQLIVHHIKPLEYYPKLRLFDDNLLTVCIHCHNSIHSTILERKRWDDEWW